MFKVNKLERCLTGSENAYFASNEQASIPVFTAAFCFTHVKHNLIKLKLCNNWSAQAVNSISQCAMWNSTKPIKSSRLEKLTNQSTLNKAQVIEIINACIVAFMKARNSLVVSWREKKKNERCILWKLYFAKIFLLTWKSCSWPTFYQMDFMKR